jgi:hypothetical protein
MLNLVHDAISRLTGETAGMSVGAAIGGGFSMWQRLKRALGQDKPAPLPKSHQGRTAPIATSYSRVFSILVAHLDGDDEGAQAARIMEVLRNHFPENGSGLVVRIKQLPKVLTDDASEPARKRGLKWLHK